MTTKVKQSNGFTIVELLIVIVIIAILAAITVVVFNGVQRRANEAAASASANAAVKKLESYKVINNAYPATLSAADINNSATTTYEYTTDGTGSLYCVTTTTNKVSMYASSTASTPKSGGCSGHSANGVAVITNYTLNPSVENGVTGGWSGNGSLTTSLAHSGTRSMTYTGAATPNDTAIYLTVAVPSAGTYYVSAYVYITGSGNSFAGMTSYGRDAMWLIGSSWVYTNYNRSLLNQWQRIQASGTTTSAGSLQLRFYPPGGAAIYVDDAMVTTASSNYADGGTAGWLWNGAVNNSTSTGLPQ